MPTTFHKFYARHKLLKLIEIIRESLYELLYFYFMYIGIYLLNVSVCDV